MAQDVGHGKVMHTGVPSDRHVLSVAKGLNKNNRRGLRGAPVNTWLVIVCRTDKKDADMLEQGKGV